jgi:hypothetical protein
MIYSTVELFLALAYIFKYLSYNRAKKKVHSVKKRTLVACVFDDADSVVDVIHELRQTGFSDDQLGFVVRCNTHEHGTNVLARKIIGSLLGVAGMLLPPISGTNISTEHRETVTNIEVERQNTQEKRDPGIIVGGVIGGTLGAVAVLRLPDIGLILAGGSLASILADASPGGIAGNFLGIGIANYEQKFQAGGIVFIIKADEEQQQEAQDILRYQRAHSIEVH